MYITRSFWHDQHNCLQYGEIYYVWFDIWYTYRIQYNRGFRGGTVGPISCNIYNLLQNIAIFHNLLQYYATLEICCSAWSKPKLSTKIDLHTPPPPPPPPQGTFIPEGVIVGFRGRVFVGWVGGGGGFHSIMWSPQLRFVLELGCDNTSLFRLWAGLSYLV